AMTDSALATVSPARAAEMARDGRRGAVALAAVASDVVRHLNLLLLLRLLCELTATTLVALVCVDTYGAGWRAALVTAGAMTVVSFVVVGGAPRTLGGQHAYAVCRADAGQGLPRGAVRQPGGAAGAGRPGRAAGRGRARRTRDDPLGVRAG